MATLHEAYLLAKKNNGAPGIDGVTFEVIEAGGVDAFLMQIRDELVAHTNVACATSAIIHISYSDARVV
jgi:RNA-directed DNA polymerase